MMCRTRTWPLTDMRWARAGRLNGVGGANFENSGPVDGALGSVRNFSAAEDVHRNYLEGDRIEDDVEVRILFAEKEIDGISARQKWQVAQTAGNGTGMDGIGQLVLLLNPR